MSLDKFSFRIRTRNGVMLERLLIQAASEEDARVRLLRMYPHSEILMACREAGGAIGAARSFEDIADLLCH